MLQWGQVTGGSSATFSTTFPSDVYRVFLQILSGPSDSDEADEYWYPTSVSTSGFTCSTVGDNAGISLNYLAIGA
jgi:hypothetical protein